MHDSIIIISVCLNSDAIMFNLWIQITDRNGNKSLVH